MKLREMCCDKEAAIVSCKERWPSVLSTTKWQDHISIVLSSAVKIANTVHDGLPVLVHCR